MTYTTAILLAVPIGLAPNVLYLVAYFIYLRLKRRRIVARSLAAFDAEFGTASTRFS